MPDEVDPFDAVAAEALAEFDNGTSVEEGLDTSNPPPTEPAAETPPAEVAPAGEEVLVPAPTPATPPPLAEKPWWEERLDEEIEYKGQKIRLSEALNDGLRQADYTRKTQELARRAQFADWGEQTLTDFRNDPVATLRSLAEQAGLIPKGQQQFDPSEEPDPALVEISTLRQQYEADMAELKQARLVEETRQEIASVRGKYPDFSDEVLKLVYEYGAERGIGLTIEDGYHLWKGQQAAQAAQAQAAAALAAEQHTAALEAARQAQVAAGHSPAANVEEPENYEGLSGGDLFDAIARAEFGGLFDDE